MNRLTRWLDRNPAWPLYAAVIAAVAIWVASGAHL